MALTDAGVEAIVDALNGTLSDVFSNANSFIGVGGDASAATAFNAAQTDLTEDNKTRKPMDTGYPIQPAADQLEFQATFGVAEANHEWKEWGIFNASSSGTMLCRKVETISGSPKTGSEAWQFTVTLTIGNP